VRKGGELEGKACDHSWLASAVLREKGGFGILHMRMATILSAAFWIAQHGFGMHIRWKFKLTDSLCPPRGFLDFLVFRFPFAHLLSVENNAEQRLSSMINLS
jgi:hypothetical protein